MAVIPPVEVVPAVLAIPAIGLRAQQAVQLGGAGVAAVAFVGIVGFRAVQRWMARDAVINASRPLFPPNVNAIRAHDPEFTPERFVKVAQSIFQQVQRARQTHNAQSVRGLMSEEFWGEFNYAETRNAAAKRQSVVERFKLHSAIIQSMVNIEGYDAIIVRFIASCAEYQEDDKGNVWGDRKVRVWREDWTFERSTDSETHLRKGWCLTQVHPVVGDRFDSHRRRSMTEWISEDTGAARQSHVPVAPQPHHPVPNATPDATTPTA